MGSLKESLLHREEGHQLNLADALGISWEMLLSLEYEVSANLSKEGLIYGYTISFSDTCNAEALSKIEGLDKNGTISLSPWVFERSYDEEYELGAISENIDHEASFLLELEASNSLQNLKIEDYETRNILLRQIFITIIGAIETFLSDQFISKTLSSDLHLEAFVANHPEFKKQKISVSDIFNVSRSIRERAKTLMVSTIYHKLSMVREMYTKTFSVDFPDISEIQKYVLIRHDLVHRNGKTIEGKLVKVNDDLLNELRREASRFVTELARQFHQKHDFDDGIPF